MYIWLITNNFKNVHIFILVIFLVFLYFRVYHSQMWFKVPTTLALPLRVLQDNAFSKSRLQESSEDLWGKATSLFWTFPTPATIPHPVTQLERMYMRPVLIKYPICQLFICKKKLKRCMEWKDRAKHKDIGKSCRHWATLSLIWSCGPCWIYVGALWWKKHSDPLLRWKYNNVERLLFVESYMKNPMTVKVLSAKGPRTADIRVWLCLFLWCWNNIMNHNYFGIWAKSMSLQTRRQGVIRLTGWRCYENPRPAENCRCETAVSCSAQIWTLTSLVLRKCQECQVATVNRK